MFDDNDPFEDVRKMMNRRFRFFNNFFDDDDFEKDVENMIKSTKNENYMEQKNHGKSKSYSISYRYGTGMKEPEIQVKGDVDQETINKFLRGVQKQFNGPRINSNNINLLKPISKSESESEDYELDAIIPFTDMVENDKGAIITLEMPGIGTEQIKVETNEKQVKISATYQDKKYHKSLDLSFKPNKTQKISANNGIITIEFLK